jgi:threonine/homoserine/homoserine lactone efflux protein
MSFDLWLAFVLASLVVVFIPGPTILLVLSCAIRRGLLASLPAISGVIAGDVAALAVALLGMGALLKAAPLAFALLTWAGAIWLIWIGTRLWQTKKELSDIQPEQAKSGISETAMSETVLSGTGLVGRELFLSVFAVTALNPKTLTFFVAFLPQFQDPRLPFWPQMLLMAMTFVVLGGINATCWAFLASKARRLLGQPRFMILLDRIGGSVLIGMGLAALLFKTGAPVLG